MEARAEDGAGREQESGVVDRMVLAIVQEEDASALSKTLNERGFPHTRINTVGGFLRRSNSVFVIGHDRRRGDELSGALRENCRTRTEPVPMHYLIEPAGFPPMLPWDEPLPEVQVGGATVFELEIEHCERI